MTRTIAGRRRSQTDRLSSVIADGGAPRIASDVIPRARLVEELDRLLPLTVLSAPRGFGKTTLATQWFATLETSSVVWISIERPGTTTGDFWRNAATAFAPAFDVGHAHPRDALRAALEGPGRPIVLIVDDLDRLADGEVVDDLLGLLRRFPRLHVVATTTAGILDRRSWLDLDGQTIGAGELAFTVTETAAFLDRMGAPADDLDGLGDQLGGWPLAVRAYALARRQADHGTALRVVRDQLAQTITDELADPAVADLALPTALLGEFTADQLGTLLDGTGTEQGVEELLARGMLIVDGDGPLRRLRWPGLVREVLLDAGVRSDPGRVRTLHRDLAARLARAGEDGQALQHAAAAEDWVLARELLVTRIASLLWHHTEILRRVFTDAPRGALGDSIQVQLAYEMFFPDAARARLLLDQVPVNADEIDEFVRVQGPPPAGYEHVAAVLGMFRLRGDAGASVEVAARAPAIIRATRHAYPDEPVAAGSGLSLQAGLAWLQAGELDRARAEFERSFRYGSTAPIQHMSRDAAAKLALLHGFTGEHARSRTWIRRADESPKVATDAVHFIDAALAGAQVYNAVASLERRAAVEAVAQLDVMHRREELWAMLHHARSKVAVLWGHPAAALRDLEDTALTAVPPPAAFAADILLATRVDLAMRRGLGSRCAGLLADSSSTAPIVQVRRARLALLVGDDRLAVDCARAAAEDRDATPSTDLEALVIEAVALQRLGDHAAGKRLGEALAVAGRRLDAFALVPRDELRALGSQVTGSGEVLDDPRLQAVGDSFPTELRITLLTQRERVVLRHLAEGLTLHAIAHRETVSINTVKSQVKSVYRKLGVTDREQALENAAREGLI